MNVAPRALVLFDGSCNLCSATVRFIYAHDPAGYFHFAPLQSEGGARALAAAGGPALSEREGFDSVVLIEGSSVRIRSDAALAIAQHLSPPWSWLSALRVFPHVVRDAAYRLLAANRYRIFGRHDGGAFPPPEMRSRFL